MSAQEAGEKILLSCPFCEFGDYDSEFLSQHVAYCHPEDPENASQPTHLHQDWAAAEGSLQVAQTGDLPSTLDNADDLYIACPYGCGEEVSKAELQLHLDLHVAESAALDESGDLHLQSVDGGDHEVARVKALDDIVDGSENDHHDWDQDESLAHGNDIVLKGKSTDNRRRHKKNASKSDSHEYKGIRRLGVSVPLFKRHMPACCFERCTNPYCRGKNSARTLTKSRCLHGYRNFFYPVI